MFYCEQSNINHGSVNESNSKLSVPTIDLTGIHDDHVLRDEVVRKVQNACEKWGFFQVLNHGISTHVLDEIMKGICRFHQDAKVRKEYYTRDFTKKVIYQQDAKVRKENYQKFAGLSLDKGLIHSLVYR